MLNNNYFFMSIEWQQFQKKMDQKFTEMKSWHPDATITNPPEKLTPITEQGINKLPPEKIKFLFEKMNELNPQMGDLKIAIQEINSTHHIQEIKTKVESKGKNYDKFIDEKYADDYQRLSPKEQILADALDPKTATTRPELNRLRKELKKNTREKSTKTIEEIYQPLQEILFEKLNYENTLLLLNTDLKSLKPQKSPTSSPDTILNLESLKKQEFGATEIDIDINQGSSPTNKPATPKKDTGSIESRIPGRNVPPNIKSDTPDKEPKILVHEFNLLRNKYTNDHHSFTKKDRENLLFLAEKIKKNYLELYSVLLNKLTY